MNLSILSRRIILAVAFVLVLPFAAFAYADTLNRQLQIGMSGADVSSLQTFLAADSSIYPEGLVTGYFGSLTKAAVARFQTKNGIDAVGRVGPITLAAINAQMGGGMSGGDVTAPTIFNVSVTPTTGGAIVRWNTNELTTGIVYHSPSPIVVTETGQTDVQITGTSVITDTILHTSHSVTISGLQSNATYAYVIYSRDAAGNVQFTWPTNFKAN